MVCPIHSLVWSQRRCDTRHELLTLSVPFLYWRQCKKGHAEQHFVTWSYLLWRGLILSKRNRIPCIIVFDTKQTCQGLQTILDHTHLSLLYTLKLLGMEENSSKHAISRVLIETISQSSTTKVMLAEQGLIMYASLFSSKMAMEFCGRRREGEQVMETSRERMGKERRMGKRRRMG